MTDGDSVYARFGVDFGKEHDVVEIFKALFRATKGNVADLERLGITLPQDIGFFSDGLELNVAELAKGLSVNTVGLPMGTDGAGTKPLVHTLYRMLGGNKPLHLASVGIDTVAMVANDVACGGGRVVALNDYVAWTKPDIEITRDLANGLKIGADLCGAVIIGGENASLKEMIRGPPEAGHQFYVGNVGVSLDMDVLRAWAAGPEGVPFDPERMIASTTIGAGYDISATGLGLYQYPPVDGLMIDGRNIQAGDVVIGIRSSGVHCNGISAARQLINYAPAGWTGPLNPIRGVSEFDGKTILEEILTPTLIYNRLIEALINSNKVRGLVNITGEGVHNLERLLHKHGFGADLDFSAVEAPHQIFGIIQEHAEIPTKEMYEDLNMGQGMYVVVSAKDADSVMEMIGQTKNPLLGETYKAEVLGHVCDDVGGALHVTTHTDEQFEYKPAA
jgi:phosphoribosylformylglycinamidine cyclo-ligase